jgi:hypothetical protein
MPLKLHHWHYIYVLSFMKIGTGVQAVLRIFLRNLRGFNVGITDGRDLLIRRCDKIRCHDICTKFHKNSFRY